MTLADAIIESINNWYPTWENNIGAFGSIPPEYILTMVEYVVDIKKLTFNFNTGTWSAV